MTQLQPGCWIEGHIGHYGSATLILIAEVYGFDNSEAIELARRYLDDEQHYLMSDEEQERTYELSDSAEVWLNANLAPEGHAFGWHDGEFFLWPHDVWEENE